MNFRFVVTPCVARLAQAGDPDTASCSQDAHKMAGLSMCHWIDPQNYCYVENGTMRSLLRFGFGQCLQGSLQGVHVRAVSEGLNHTSPAVPVPMIVQEKVGLAEDR